MNLIDRKIRERDTEIYFVLFLFLLYNEVLKVVQYGFVVEDIGLYSLIIVCFILSLRSLRARPYLEITSDAIYIQSALRIQTIYLDRIVKVYNYKGKKNKLILQTKEQTYKLYSTYDEPKEDIKECILGLLDDKLVDTRNEKRVVEIEERHLDKTLFSSIFWIAWAVLMFFLTDNVWFRYVLIFGFFGHLLKIAFLGMGLFIRIDEDSIIVQRQLRFPKRIPMDQVHGLSIEKSRFRRRNLRISFGEKNYKLVDYYERSLEEIKDLLESYQSRREEDEETRS